MRVSRMLLYIAISGVLFSTNAPLMAQVFRVLVLDAVDGSAQSGVEVRFFCTGRKGNEPPQSVTTSSSGLAEIPFRCGTNARIGLSLVVPPPKLECGKLAPLDFDDISARGVISTPNGEGNLWCPAKISSKKKSVPGLVLVFVKKPAWWQTHAKE